MNLLGKLNLTTSESKTFKLHLGFNTLEGFMAGAVVLNEFIFLRSMEGSNYMLSFLWQFSMMVLLPTIIFNEFLKRTKNKKKLLRIVSWITRGPLFLLLLFPTSTEVLTANPIYHYLFLALFLNYYLSWPLIFPTINLFLRMNYRHENFGKLFSYATSAKAIVTMLGTFLFGIWLDIDPFAFRFMYPIIAVMGVLSIIVFTRIPYVEPEGQSYNKSLGNSIRESFKRAWIILKENKGYRDFEIAFMLYGFAFMVTVSVITIYLESELHLNYSSLAFYKNGAATLSIILMPFFGKLLGNIDPRKFGTIPFAALILYFSFVLISQFYPQGLEFIGLQVVYLLVCAFLFFGLFSATMHLLWSIGSAYFCKDEDAGDYQAVHLSLTGLRASFTPILGVFFYEQFGYSFTFALGIIALLIGIWVLNRSVRKKP